MKLSFIKYEGTGNDFILIDDRAKVFPVFDVKLVHRLCDRRFGIGADGLILLQNDPEHTFRMVYFNADGKEGSMCGNGGRCFVAFANELGLIKDEINFSAADGLHSAIITDPKNAIVKLKMVDVPTVEFAKGYVYLNTGSPHYVLFEHDVMDIDVVAEGRGVRNNERFRKEGTNVNFVQSFEKGVKIRTYERGVEDETLSCGTGSVASALAAAIKGIVPASGDCKVRVMGGELKVYFEKNGNGFKNIWLEGPATFVYKGEIDV
jgi:diaminopimelate epimerase